MKFRITQLLFLILLISALSLFAQDLVQDTLIISFQPFNKDIFQGVSIDSVIDNREEKNIIIGRYEKNKYMFIPVDLFICTKNPLPLEISTLYNCPKQIEHTVTFKLIINEFDLSKKTNSLFYPHYLLNASVSVYWNRNNDESEFLGQLLYESAHRPKFFRDKLQDGFSKVLQKWQQEFAADLSLLASDDPINSIKNMENIRFENYCGKSTNMYIGTDFILGTNSWMTDYDIIFSHSEARNRFFRNGYNIRYRNEDTFESIEFGVSSDYLFSRFHPDFIFRGKSQLMYGFNRWNDIDIFKHELWDAFIADFSLSQSLIYNPLDRRSIIFGFGVVENVYYIYSKKCKFQVGLLIHLGIKL